MNIIGKAKFSSLFYGFLYSLIVIMLAGCGDFFAEKPTELETRNILRMINQKDRLQQNQPVMQGRFSKEAKIVEGESDARLFYFAKHRSADSLSSMVNTHFIKKFFDPKGKTHPVVDYNVTPNHYTNQLIVRCPTVSDARQVLEFLELTDHPPAQVRIDCLISEVYTDITMDWETTIMIKNLLGEDVTLDGKESGDNLLPAFPGAALRDNARALFGLKTGLVRNKGVSGHEFRALVDLLKSRGYLKVLMNPTLEVLAGKTARIKTNEHMPLDQITNIHPVSGMISQSTKYYDIIDSLEITPYVFANGYISLKTEAVLGSKSAPEGVKKIPIVTERRVNNLDNRIRHGESLIIAGITKTEKRSVIRGVPFLKDIPLIGVFFSSKDFEERGKEVLFIITPTISDNRYGRNSFPDRHFAPANNTITPDFPYEVVQKK